MLGVQEKCRVAHACRGAGNQSLGLCGVCGLPVCPRCGDIQHPASGPMVVHDACLPDASDRFTMIRIVRPSDRT